MIGLLVQLGVQGDDAAVSIFELAVQVQQLVLALTQLCQRAHQLTVLLLQLLIGPLGEPARELGCDPGQVHACHDGCPRRQDLLQMHVRAGLRSRSDVHLIHEAMDAEDADPHAGLRPVTSPHDLFEVADSRTVVAYPGDQYLRRAFTL